MYDEPYDAYDAELAREALREIEDAPPYQLTVEQLVSLAEDLA